MNPNSNLHSIFNLIYLLTPSSELRSLHRLWPRVRNVELYKAQYITSLRRTFNLASLVLV
ncbi:uncharacterized protein DS421_8g229210 [Arachis hypogaea]|nr:uncharacterized protein DS421_8g229210 [Arachis hypogaea]